MQKLFSFTLLGKYSGLLCNLCKHPSYRPQNRLSAYQKPHPFYQPNYGGARGFPPFDHGRDRRVP